VNPIFTLLPQPAPPQPSTGAVRFGSPIGYARGMFQRTWRPLWSVNFVLDLPWRNSRLRGLAAQAESSRQRAEIQERDLLRVVRENVVSQVGSLRRQAEGIERAQAAADASQQTVDAVLLRFQQMDQTLIDTLLAEESLTQDRLTLIGLWRDYLSELARLRFETGTILSFTGNRISPDQIRFDPTEYVRR
jgi:outer membrane protein